MILKVETYHPHPLDFHQCRDENGMLVQIDLTTDKFIDSESLVGRTVEIEGRQPYIYIAYGVRVLPEVL